MRQSWAHTVGIALGSAVIEQDGYYNWQLLIPLRQVSFHNTNNIFMESKWQ